MNDLEDMLRRLLRGKFSSLSITFNEETAPNYWTVEDAYTSGYLDKNDWVSEDEKQLAIQNNSMWTLHFYPDTPIGFIRISASSLIALLMWVSTHAD